MTRLERTYAPHIRAMLCVLAVMLITAAFTGQWPTRANPYNSYLLQDLAWLQGRLDLPDGAEYDWLELAIYNGRYYVSFPPFPSYVLLPFAALFGLRAPEALLAWLTTLLGVFYAVELYRSFRRDGRSAFWVSFLYLGTGYLFLSMNAYVWFIAQTMCFTLSLMALVHARRGQGGVSLACWACAVGCRPMAALYLPVLVWLLWPDKGEDSLARWVLRRWRWAIAPLLLAGSYMALNAARFGNPLQFGHDYLPEFVRAEHGQFSLTYIPGNLKLLLRLPGWNSETQTLVFHTWQTMAFWLVNPMDFCIGAAWLSALRRRERNLAWFALPVLAFCHVFLLCCHRTMGAWQFGNRYLVDLMPWLFCGLLAWAPRGERFTRWCAPFFAWGAALNLLGTVLAYTQ